MDDISKEIGEYLVERKWDTLEPADLAKSIMIEGAELLELFQWKNHTTDEIESNPELLQNLKKELADVMIYAIELAVRLDMSPEDIIRQKMDHNRKKYPVDKVTDAASADAFIATQKKRYRAAGK